MPIPFQAASWKFRAAHGLPAINGTYSGTVGRAVGGYLHAPSGVVQVFGQSAHHFETWFNAARTSHDEGKSWTTSYLGVQESQGIDDTNEVVGNVWSLDTDAGTYHYQFRWRLRHSFFLADGSIKPGWMRLYISQDGVNFQVLQDLYTWPAVNDIPGSSGGQASFNTFPGCTVPIKIEGSGPAGEDAWWLAANVNLEAGGSSNPFSFQKAGLWYSLDGFTWELGNDLSTDPIFSGASAFSGMFQAQNGRVFVSSSVNLAHTDDDDDLFNATWTNLAGQYDTALYSMYGGTLLTARHGTLISGGFARVSCDNGSSFINIVDADGIPAPGIPVGFPAFPLKIGPAEAIIITNGGGSPSTETVTYYSADGGETWVGGEVWTSSLTGERVAMAAIRSNGTPFVVTGDNVFFCTDSAQGNLVERTICPLANAGLAAARPLVVCGLPISNDICEP